MKMHISWLVSSGLDPFSLRLRFIGSDRIDWHRRSFVFGSLAEKDWIKQEDGRYILLYDFPNADVAFSISEEIVREIFEREVDGGSRITPTASRRIFLGKQSSRLNPILEEADLLRQDLAFTKMQLAKAREEVYWATKQLQDTKAHRMPTVVSDMLKGIRRRLEALAH